MFRLLFYKVQKIMNRTRIFRNTEARGAGQIMTTDNPMVAVLSKSGQYRVDYDSLSDVSNSGFGDGNSTVVINPCSRHIRRVSSYSGSLDWYRADGTLGMQYVSFDGYPHVLLYLKLRATMLGDCNVGIASLEDFNLQSAKVKALQKISKPEFDFAEDIAEFQRTVDLLQSPTQEYKDLVQKFQKALRKRGKLKALYIADATADLVLSTSFGAGNLILSFIRALDYFTNKATPPKVRVAHGVQFSDEIGRGTKTLSWSETSSETFSRTLRLENRTHAYVYYYFTNPIDSFRELCGLELKDVPRTLWAITSCSWFFDQIYSIGGAIENLTTLSDPELIIIGAGVGIKNTVTDTWVMDNKKALASADYWTMVSTPSGTTSFTQDITRSLWTPGAGDALPPEPLFLKNLSRMATVSTDIAFTTKILSNLIKGKLS